MAIDLFVNFERYSNNSLFYRVTASSPSTYTVRLKDDENVDESLNSLYRAEYSLDSTSYINFPVDDDGNYTVPVVFNTARPCVCSVSIRLTSVDTRNITTLQMRGKFLKSLPSIDFIAYPSLYIDLETGYQVDISSTNYLSASQGLSFYGEGHTETINLSSNNRLNTNHQVSWLVGNTFADITSRNYINSYYPIRSVNNSYNQASVSIISLPGQAQSIPISVWLTNLDVTSDGPIITYNDETGIPEYYPFFNSTITPDNNFFKSTLFKDNIEVLNYPSANPKILSTPFEGDFSFLPLDYSYKTFTATTNANSNIYSNLVTESFVSTKWEISADVRKDSNIIGWSHMTETLHGCKSYQFSLAYDTALDPSTNLLSFYKTSIDYPTTITLTLSAVKNIQINAASDWAPKQVTFVSTVTANIGAVPSSKIYTQKFYNVKGETVKFGLVDLPPWPYELLTASISSINSTDTLFLSTGQLTGTMVFNSLGPIDLSSKIVYINTTTNVVYETLYTYPDVVEIVQTYDEIADERYFQTESTPLYLPYTEQPKISPNEWVTDDNVNSVITKMYKTIESLYQYTSLYVEKNVLYGYMMPIPKTQVNALDGVVNSKVLTWLSLDCTDSNVVDNPTWADFEEIKESNTWRHQFTDAQAAIDPACFQKHCTRWSWKWRKKGKSELDITWGDAKQLGQFPKKWKYEKCVIDTTIDCNYVSWKLSTDRSKEFIIPTSSPHSLCHIIDADVLYSRDKLVLAREHEIYVVEKDYRCNFVDRIIMADDLFPFQQIAGIATTVDDKILVLDKLLPRVSVYDFVDNDLILRESWGSYGKQTTPFGLNQPLDICVDKYNSVWVADGGNNCVKKFTIIGKPLATLTHSFFETEGILSVCVDSVERLHCLTNSRVVVFDSSGSYIFNYALDNITNPKKINASFNKEMIYITYDLGIVKYFRNGIFSHFILKDLICADGNYLQNYNSVMQDKFRNVYVTAGDKLLQIQDIQQTVQLAAPIKPELYWTNQDLLIHKEEYIQPWVYLKSFHRLWDNIELLRNSIFYSTDNICKSFVSPIYKKEDIIVGQNEIVTNSVINRLTEQLWTNLQSLIKFFDPNCKN